MAALVGVRKGVDALTSASSVERKRWRQLVLARRVHCQQNFRDDCRALLFFVEDGRNNSFLSYPDEETYLREGLSLDPATCAAVADYLRAHGENAISFKKAAKLGQRGRPKKGEEKGRNPTFSKRGKDYDLARLDRDGHSKLAAKVRSGAMSANAAAISAGYRKKPTPLDRLRKDWKAASLDQQSEFFAEVTAEMAQRAERDRAA